MRVPTLRSALALVLLALALCLGQPGRAFGGSPEQAPDSGPSQIAIPAIDLVAEVVPVGYQLSKQTLGWQTAEDAVAWHRSSAMPGSPGNAVMSGHNATRGSGVFRKLHKVELGDRITVTVNGQELDYVVTERVTFPQVFASEYRRARNAAWLGHFGDQRLTLVTCYPWWTNTHRLVVVAHPVGSSDD
jgi:sortase A